MHDAETTVRCSALSTYADCPRRSAARLFRREIEAAGFDLRRTPTGIGAAIGIAVHKGAEVSLAEKAATGTLPPESFATDAATESLGETIRQGVQYDSGRAATTLTAQEAESQVLSMTRAYHRCTAPSIEPLAVERRLEAEVAPGLVLSGRFDVVAIEPAQIRDLKTGARRIGDHRPQVGGYSLLVRSNAEAIFGEERPVDVAVIDFVQRVPARRRQPDPVSAAVDLALAETAAVNVLRHIESDLATWRNGDPERGLQPGDPWAFLANPASILCSPRFCPAFGTAFCREHRQIVGVGSSIE